MKLVADIDKIIDNAMNLEIGVQEFEATLSTFSSTDATFDTSEISSIVESYIASVASDLETLDNSANSYVSLIDEATSEYQKNEANTTAIDISNVQGINISENTTTTKNTTTDSKEKVSNVNLGNIKSTSTKEIDMKAAKKSERISRALQKYGSEIENATYAKINDKTFMTVVPTVVNSKKCLVSHVVVDNPSQIYGEPANGSYASGLETPSSAARRTGAQLLINGSHFSYDDGSEDLKGTNNIVIADGEIRTNGTAGNMEICLDKNGRLFTSNKSAEQLKNEGVVYTFSSHGAPMIENGSISPICSQETRIYNRTVIGMVEPCDYYIVTDLDTQSQTATANFLLSKGCTFAKSLDQGGSVALVYEGNMINPPRDGSERAVGDFICFDC